MSLQEMKNILIYAIAAGIAFTCVGTAIFHTTRFVNYCFNTRLNISNGILPIIY